MQLAGEQRIDAPREAVWKALNDPAVLRICVPGCESLTRDEEGAFAGAIRVKVGPVKSVFRGTLTMQDMEPPARCTMAGHGEGGVAGMAKGSVDISLADQGAQTVLTYNATADVSGRLAQIGSRLVQSTAQKYANDFFYKFNEVVSGKVGVVPAAVADATPSPDAPSAPGRREAGEDPRLRHLQRVNWALVAIIALLSVALIVK